jgi:hypothetical protein
MILQDIGMIYVLKFVSSFVGVSFHAHHNKRLESIKNAFSPYWGPTIIPCNYLLYDIIISISSEGKIGMIESVQNYTDIPQFTTLLDGRLITFLDLFRRKILSMIVLLFVKSLLLHIHEVSEVNNLAYFLLLLRPDSPRSLGILVSDHLHLLLIKEARVDYGLTRVCQWLFSYENI